MLCVPIFSALLSRVEGVALYSPRECKHSLADAGGGEGRDGLRRGLVGKRGGWLPSAAGVQPLVIQGAFTRPNHRQARTGVRWANDAVL